MMIKLSLRALVRLSIATLFLVTLLTGCGATAGVPATATPQATTPATSTASQPTSVLATSTASQPTSAPATSTASQPTDAPAQLPTSAPTAAPSEASTGDAAAIQTVLDYYDAINQRAYDRAYNLWAQNGAASNQTAAQFTQGLTDTVQVSVQLATPSASGNGFSVPITLTAIVNLPNHDQKVQHFHGTYDVQPSADGWRIAGANVAETSGDAQTPADVSDPLALLKSYYAAINSRELARAFTYWNNNGAASKQTFAQFSQGFATTGQVVIDTGKVQTNGAAGSIYADVPSVIVATQKDGSQQTFCGTYTLRHLNVPPFDQLGWRIEQANIAPAANVQANSDQEQRLLNNGCQP